MGIGEFPFVTPLPFAVRLRVPMLVSLSVAPFEAMSVLTEPVSYLLSTLAVKSLKPETVWLPLFTEIRADQVPFAVKVSSAVPVKSRLV